MIDEGIAKNKKEPPEKAATPIFLGTLGRAYKGSAPVMKSVGKTIGKGFLAYGEHVYKQQYGSIPSTKRKPHKKKAYKRRTSKLSSKGKTITIRLI